MKITDMIISALLKKGILYEARNCNVDVDIPQAITDTISDASTSKIKVNIKIEHMTLRIEKE
jgi:hypothetical protein